MGRPRKHAQELKRARSVYATNAEWARVLDEAKAVGIGVSKYLIEHRSNSRLPGQHDLRRLDEIEGARAALVSLADGVLRARISRSAEILQAVADLDRRLALLAAEGDLEC